MKRLFIFIMLLTSALSPNDSFGQKDAERYSLAVLNFKMDGSSLYYSDVRFITGEFINELVQAKLFHTMSQMDMERGLINKNIDPNANCNEIKCALKAAAALGVQLVIIGSLVEEDNKFKLEVKMLHVVSQKVVKIQNAEFDNNLSRIYYNLPGFASDFLGIRRKDEVRQEEQTLPVEKKAVEPDEKYELPYTDFNFVEEDTTEAFEPGEIYPSPNDTEVIDTGAIYYPEESKLKKVLYWGLGAVAIGGFSASIIMLSGDDSGGGGNPSNDLPDPPVFP